MQQGALNIKGTRRVQLEAPARCTEEVDQRIVITHLIAEKDDAAAVVEPAMLEGSH